MKIERKKEHISFIHGNSNEFKALLIIPFSSFVVCFENVESPTHDFFTGSECGLSKILLLRFFLPTSANLRKDER